MRGKKSTYMWSWQYSAQEVGKQTYFGWLQDVRGHEQKRALEVFSQVWKHQTSISLASIVEW